MFIRVSDSHMRSISKAISWRIVGTIDTFVITLVITGNFVVAGSIASVESISKIILYIKTNGLGQTSGSPRPK